MKTKTKSTRIIVSVFLVLTMLLSIPVVAYGTTGGDGWKKVVTGLFFSSPTTTYTYRNYKVKINNNNNVYNGKAHTCDVKVKKDKKTLEKGKDYKISYKNNKKVGNATLTIKFIKKHKKIKSCNHKFVIVPRAPKISNLVYHKKTLKVSFLIQRYAEADKVKWSLIKDGETIKEASFTKKSDKVTPDAKLASGVRYHLRAESIKGNIASFNSQVRFTIDPKTHKIIIDK